VPAFRSKVHLPVELAALTVIRSTLVVFASPWRIRFVFELLVLRAFLVPPRNHFLMVVVGLAGAIAGRPLRPLLVPRVSTVASILSLRADRIML
jgi:hypothetical protein